MQSIHNSSWRKNSVLGAAVSLSLQTLSLSLHSGARINGGTYPKQTKLEGTQMGTGGGSVKAVGTMCDWACDKDTAQ